MKSKKGFTLVELLAVIAILAILMLIAIPNVLNLYRNARKNTFKSDVQSIIRASEQAYVMNSIGSKNRTCFDSVSNPLEIDARENLVYVVRLTNKGKIISIEVADNNYQILVDDSNGIEKDEIGKTYEIDARNKTTDIISCNNSFLVEGEEGSGEENAPYKIQYIEDLVELSEKTNSGETYAGKTIILSRDLDFKNKDSYKDKDNSELYTELTTGNGFTPIKTFSGTFDGKNHRIDNLYIHNTSNTTTQVAFIKNLFNGTVKNLTISGNVKSDYNADIAGITANLVNSTIDNCINEANIEISNVSTYAVGGLAASGNSNSIIKNSINKADLTLEGGNIMGGLFGVINSSGGSLLIENSYNEGNIISLKAEYVGGIMGKSSNAKESSITIKNSYNNGEIKFNSEEDKNVNMGGLIGYAAEGNTIEITNSGNNANITNLHTNFNVEKNIFMGGIIGTGMKSKSIILNKVYNTGNLKDGKHIGGILGDITSIQKIIINQGYNNGTISQNVFTNVSFVDKQIGGLIGYIKGSTSYIINSHNTGDINQNETNNPAGLVGYNYGGANTHIYNSYNTSNGATNGITIVSSTNESSLTLNNVYNVGNVSLNGIASVGTNAILNIKNAYYKNDTIKKGTGLSNDSALTTGKSESEIKSQSFVTLLNTNKSNINLTEIDSRLSGYTLCDWKLGTSGYPELDCK